MKIINKLICHFKGHVGLQRGQEYDRIYHLSENVGAFCRETIFTCGGRLYRCSRCGELCICHGVTSWELQDLIQITLKDLPRGILENAFSFSDYDFCRIYQ